MGGRRNISLQDGHRMVGQLTEVGLCSDLGEVRASDPALVAAGSAFASASGAAGAAGAATAGSDSDSADGLGDSLSSSRTSKMLRAVAWGCSSLSRYELIATMPEFLACTCSPGVAVSRSYVSGSMNLNSQ